jgi:hypothetical protein
VELDLRRGPADKATALRLCQLLTRSRSPGSMWARPGDAPEAVMPDQLNTEKVSSRTGNYSARIPAARHTYDSSLYFNSWYWVRAAIV